MSVRLLGPARSSARRLVVRLAAGVALVAAVSGCGHLGGSSGQQEQAGAGGLGAAPTASTQTGDAGAAGAETTPAGQPAPGQPAPGQPAPGQPAGGGTHAPGAPPAGPSTAVPDPQPKGPNIRYFRIKQAPQCPAGTTKFPVPAVPLVIEWSVVTTNAVTLAVDGPGEYGSYKAQGSETFTFSCGGKPGTVEQHTYTIRATENGIERTKMITATATVNEIPEV